MFDVQLLLGAYSNRLSNEAHTHKKTILMGEENMKVLSASFQFIAVFSLRFLNEAWWGIHMSLKNVSIS